MLSKCNGRMKSQISDRGFSRLNNSVVGALLSTLFTKWLIVFPKGEVCSRDHVIFISIFKGLYEIITLVTLRFYLVVYILENYL